MSHTNLEKALRSRRPGYSLEAPFYQDEAFFAADMELIFGRHWIGVGIAPQIPEEGDYLTVQVGRNSILIVRDDDGEIRAFHNVCRHRGTRLCSSQHGSMGRIVCPYHQWTYDFSGNLINAKHMPDDFDRSEHGLKPVHLRNLEGLLFICLADDPPPDFDRDLIPTMTPYLAPHRLNDCKVAAQVEIIEEGNWKLTMENNRECYHCVGNHPELTIPLYEQGFGYKPGPESQAGMERFEKAVAKKQADWDALNLPSREVEVLDRVTGFRTQRLPIDNKGESQTMDTKVACSRLLGNFTSPELGGLSFWTQPNTWHHFMSDHVVSFAVLPMSATKTLLRTTWSVHRDAVEGRDYSLENLTKVWNATNAQDRRLVEESQFGMRSPQYQPGPYSPYTEALVEKFTAWYISRMLAGLEAGPR